MKVFIGIDPGKTGAIAFLTELSFLTIEVYDYEDLEGLNRLKEIYQSCDIFALIEKQQSFPKQGIASTFKLGENYGIWQGRLQALNIPYEIITSAKWRKEIFDSMPKKEDTKEMSLDLARRLFPQLATTHLKRKKDHGRAEALLIAEVCRRAKG